MNAKGILKLGIILFIICALSTGLLAYVNSVTLPVITKNAELKETEAKKEVLPGADKFTEIDENISKGEKENEIVGYAVSVAPKGYGGAINMMVGVSKDYKVTGVKILSMAETPGLGAKANDKAFTDLFKGKSFDINLVKKAPKENEILAITGATRTSKAVTDGVKEALEIAKNKGGASL